MPLVDEPIAAEDVGGEFEQPWEIELGLVLMFADECGVVDEDVVKVGIKCPKWTTLWKYCVPLNTKDNTVVASLTIVSGV